MSAENNGKSLAILLIDTFLRIKRFLYIGKAKEDFSIIDNHVVFQMLQDYLNTFEEKNKVYLDKYTPEQRKEIIAFIKIRTRCWLDFFKKMKESKLTSGGEDCNTITSIQPLMANHMRTMRKVCLAGEISEEFLDGFDKKIYYGIFAHHRKMVVSVLIRNVFSKTKIWYHIFRSYMNSIIQTNNLTIRTGYKLYESDNVVKNIIPINDQTPIEDAWKIIIEADVTPND